MIITGIGDVLITVTPEELKILHTLLSNVGDAQLDSIAESFKACGLLNMSTKEVGHLVGALEYNMRYVASRVRAIPPPVDNSIPDGGGAPVIN